MVYIDKDLKRFYLCGCRVHHGLVGVTGYIASIAAAAYFASLIVDDWHDRPWFPKRELKDLLGPGGVRE